METSNVILQEMTIDADQATVFAFFTDPQRLIRWMGASAKIDPRPGGLMLVDVQEGRSRAGLCPLPFGIGLHLGAVMYGNIGAPDRLDFTAIGPAVNMASRIEEMCRLLSCPVLISQPVAERYSGELAPLGPYPLRGIARPVGLFTLPELAPSGRRP